MTSNLKDINFGINEYCGPSVLSALTGEDTDRCAAVISAVSGRKEIKAVSHEHLREALKRLRFDVAELNYGGNTLYASLYQLHNFDGLYIIFLPKHVVAIEVKDKNVFICDNHTKTPLNVSASARLSQKIIKVFKVAPKNTPKFIESIIKVDCDDSVNRITITKINKYENSDDNTQLSLGYIRYSNFNELAEIIKKLNNFTFGIWKEK